MNKTIKLLIIGASNKSTRSIARSLKKKNCETFVLNDEDLAVSKSKYISKFILKPEIKNDINKFKIEIINAVSEFKIDVVIPSTDIAVDVVLKFKEEIEKHVAVIGLNPKEIYKYAHNKYELLKLAQETGLKIPGYIYVDNLSFDKAVLKKLNYPVVVKPVSSAQIIGDKHYGYKVAFPKTEKELIDILRELVPNTAVMVQDYIEGYGIGYNVYCINGEIKSEFIHKRLKENAGVSSYRKIIPIDSYSLKEKVHLLLKKIRWNGVAMVEFRIDKNNAPYIMEMNGRFFGSTELGVKAGYDLPAFLYSDQFLKKPEINTNTGKYYSLRLLHDEVLLETAKLMKTKNILNFLKWNFSLFNLLSPNNYLEASFFDDPKFVINLYKYDLRRNAIKRKNGRSIKEIAIKKITANEFKTMKNIVFVCLGNICRSPFAELYAKKIFPDKRITSVGTVSLQNRFSPLDAVDVAKKWDVDLSMHQSKHLKSVDITATQAFIVMDKLNYYELLKLDIPVEKIYFLSENEIKDPYKKPIFEYEQIYTQIKKNIDALM